MNNLRLSSTSERHNSYPKKARFLFLAMGLIWAFLPSFLHAQKVIPLVLGAGYKFDSVIVLVDKDTLFNQVVTSSLVSGFAREIKLPKEKNKHIKVSFVINRYKVLTLVIDPGLLKRHSGIVVNAYSFKKFPAICRLNVEIVNYKKRFFY